MRHLTVQQAAYHCIRQKTCTNEEHRFRTGACFVDDADTSAGTVSVSVSAGGVVDHWTSSTRSKGFLRISHRTRTLRHAGMFHVPLAL